MAKKTSAQANKVGVRGPAESEQNALPGVPEGLDLLRLVRKRLTDQARFIEQISYRRFRKFLDSIPSLIVHIGTDQRVKFCNAGFSSFLGVRSKATIGKHFWDVLSRDYDSIRPHVLEGLGGRQVTFEQSLHGARKKYFHVTITPDFALDNVIHGVFIALLDITSRKRLEEKQRRNEKRFRELAHERAELLRRAEDAGKVKDNFLATLSHELRTPLMSIVGWATLMRSRTLSPDRLAEGVAAIERNARSQSRMIEELLDLSRITSGKMPLEVSIVKMGNLVKAMVDSLRPAFGEKRLQLELKLSDRIPPLRGDRERLQQVIMNLLSNALKFTPAGGRVHVEVNRTPSYVQVEVEDNGQGIPREFLPYVFDEFRQADMSSSRQKEGLGLGLSIARRIVELHHGVICATSPGPGLGATFVVTLPVTSTANPPMI